MNSNNFNFEAFDMGSANQKTEMAAISSSSARYDMAAFSSSAKYEMSSLSCTAKYDADSAPKH